MQPGYLVAVFLSIRVGIQENNLKKLLVVISLSRFMTTWAMRLKGGEEVGRGAEEQHCKWNANLWNVGSLLILKQTEERSIDKEETAGLVSMPAPNYL